VLSVRTDDVRLDHGREAQTEGVMADLLDDLARDVKNTVKEACAKVAEIYFIKKPIENEFQRGYDTAAREIAARIRSL
jgi:hypothetical protein